MLSRSSAVPRELCNAGSSVSVFPISTSQASIVCFMYPRRCSHTPHVYISSSVYSTSSINNALSKTTTSYGAMKVPIPANLKKKKKKKKKKCGNRRRVCGCLGQLLAIFLVEIWCSTWRVKSVPLIIASPLVVMMVVVVIVFVQLAEIRTRTYTTSFSWLMVSGVEGNPMLLGEKNIPAQRNLEIVQYGFSPSREVYS